MEILINGNSNSNKWKNKYKLHPYKHSQKMLHILITEYQWIQKDL